MPGGHDRGSSNTWSFHGTVFFNRWLSVAHSTTLAILPTIVDRGEVAIVVDDEGRIQGLLTKLDLIDYMTRSAGKEAEQGFGSPE